MNPKTYSYLRMGVAAFALLSVMISTLGVVQPVQAAPSKEPIYYLAMPEDDALQAFRDSGGATAVSPVRSVTSIAIASTGTVIYYDQWENGFAADIRTGADLVFGDGNPANGCPPSISNTPNPCMATADDTLQAGDIVVLDNLVTVNGAPGGYSRNPAQVFFDGRDKLQATFPIAVSRALWPTGPGSLQAGGVEMFEYGLWGSLYEFPFGESTTNTGLFEHVVYFVIAGVGGSTVDVDTNGDGAVDATYVMAEGGKQAIHAPLAGGTLRVVSGSNVQVTVAYSDIQDTYEMRWSGLLPRADWENNYYSPVGTNPTTVAAACTNVWVYNPKTSAITVNWALGGGATGSFNVPARSVAVSNTRIGLNQGARFYTTDPADAFLPFSVTDCGGGGQIYDWDTSLFPASKLTPEILVGWAPGCTNESHLGVCRDADGSPNLANSVSRSLVWVTSLANTTIYVDTNGSGITCPGGGGAEQTVAATALASYRIDDDPTSQSNVRDLFNTNGSYTGSNGSVNWAAAPWTETDAGGGGAGGGYAYVTNNELRIRDNGGNQTGTIVQRPVNLTGQTFARFSFRIQSTNAEAGDDIAVEVTSDGTNWFLLERIQAPVTYPGANIANKVYNISPYISANTAIRFRMVDDLEATEYWQIDNVNIQYAPNGDFDMTGAYIRTCDGTKIAAAYGQNPALSESSDNEALDLGTVITPYYILVDLELDKQVSDDTPDIGQTVTFTLRVNNAGTTTATNIDVTDVVPDGYTYVAGTIAGGDSRDDASPYTPNGLTWTINLLLPGNFVDLTYDATVLANDTGTREYNNYAEIQDHDQPDDDSNPGNGSTDEDDDDSQPVVPNGAISGTVTADTNNDDAGDTPLVGVTVELYADTDGDGDPDGAALQSTTTAADGTYAFTGLVPGTYVVVQTNLPGYQDVTDGDSTVDMPGSPTDVPNASPVDNWLPVNLASAEQDGGNDFVDELEALSIAVTKTADDNSIPETGQAVTFTVAVQNTGTLDAILDSLTDSIFNNITTTGHDGITATTCATGGTILVGNTYTCTFTATVRGDFGGPDHVNIVTAQVSNGTDTASDTDDETITFEDVLPTVDVTKTADPTSLPEPGGNVDFTVTVQNTSAESVVVDSLTDSIFNDITTAGHDGITATDCGTGAVLLPGDMYTCTFTATITGNAGALHTNVVTGTVRDDDGNTANDTDDATVTITNVASSAVLEKTADPTSVPEPGADATFTVRVDNTSTVDVLTLTALSDDIYGDIADGTNPNLVSTTCAVPQTLDPGSFYECEFVAFVGGNDGDSLTDTVTATLTDNEQNTLNPSDDATVDVVGALIGVAKRVVGTPVEVLAGVYRVTYEILVENFGSVALTNLLVTDDLSITFPMPTTFTVKSVSSADFSVNWPGYDGQGITGNIDLLTGVDTLAVGGSGTITLVVEVLPAETGPFDNVAIASGLTPSERRVIDRSQDGIDPDPDGDDNPTNNNVPTPVDFGPRLFDPPFGLKWVDGSGEPVLQWKMVWINNTNIVAVNAAVHDPIPVGTVYVASGAASGYPVPAGAPAGSTNVGVTCTDASVVTLTTNCYYEGPTGPYPRGRIVWDGTLGPDFGVTDPAVAVNDITITFSVTVATGITTVENIATIDSDLNGDGDVNDTGEVQVARASATWEKEQVVQPALPKFILPVTGFAPGRVTGIGSAPVGAYDASGDLRLVIPSLRVSIPIVGVPLTDSGWDVTWLWKQAGWLEGTAYPTLSGNSVLTAHVYDANGLPGPFVNLGSLKWGDRVIVAVNGNQFIYEVRTNEVVSSNNINAIKHEEKTWLTLVTCKGYDLATNTYQQRVVVRAVLLEVQSGAVSTGR